MTGLLEMTKKILTRHKEYIQSSYHIRNPRLIKEREMMLDDIKSDTHLMAPLFLEAPPKYHSNKNIFNEMDLENSVKKILTRFSENRLGVWNPPYRHQAEAIEEFLTNGKDLIVTTGTGSGKTEIFTYSTLGRIAKESLSSSKNELGIRTLLLYPMNALVSDQLTRIRKMFGINPDEGTRDGKSPIEILSEIRGENSRPFRFAMYTGRTPYHGKYDSSKNDRQVKKMSDYFRKLDGDLEKKLQEMGRIPQKNMAAFRNFKGKIGDDFEGVDPKYRPHDEDAEYLTRQEILDEDSRKYYGGGTPDLLITNYSMLEYMLIRPIEQPILDDTKNWLKNNPNEQILMVLDEAHLYRGSGGAEVALLLRRFMQRLGVGPDRFRFILTSASFNEGAVEFASKLTGKKDAKNWHQQSATPKRYGQSPVDADNQTAVSLVNFGNELDGKGLVRPSQLNDFAKENGWENPPLDINNFEQDKNNAEIFLGDNLNDWEIFKFFADSIGHPIKVEELSKRLFPDSDENTALEAVLQLSNMASMAKINKNNIVEPLLPTRLHLFFRGLPEHYICSSNICESRRYHKQEFLGKMYLQSRFICECGCRVYRLDTCRDCGTAYLKANVEKSKMKRFVDGQLKKIQLWTEGIERGGCEVHVMPIPKKDRDRDYGDNLRGYLDTKSGTFYTSKHDAVSDQEFLVDCLIGNDQKMNKSNFKGFTFSKCGRCLEQIATSSPIIKIQDLETKGEQPLSNILAELFSNQPEKSYMKDPRDIPNKGKKVLVFSDSRAKASRLARSIQGDIEKDAMRIALLKSLHEQHHSQDESKLDKLYGGFLWYCSIMNLKFFQRKSDRQNFTKQVDDLYETLESYDLIDGKMKDDPDLVINNEAQSEFISNLLHILGDKFTSIYRILVGYLDVDDELWNRIYRRNKEKFNKRKENEIRTIVRLTLMKAAEERAIGKKVKQVVRNRSRSYWRTSSQKEGLSSDRGNGSSILYPELEEILIDIGWKESELAILSDFLQKESNLIYTSLDNSVTIEGNNPESMGRKVVSMNTVSLITDVKEENWKICNNCLFYSHDKLILNGICARCGSSDLEDIDKDSPHVNTRMSFYRNEIIRKFDENEHPYTIRAEEHTAQVNTRDSSINDGVASKAEIYELEFQDVLMGKDANLGRDQPVDILSCTTTMEVGIDIGSLTAVAMRTVPPRPDNYQQRSGRAGRRGSAMSTIVTYANNSPHEQHYFLNPGEIIGAETNDPFLQIDNKRLSERHINAMLFQIYFTEIIDARDSSLNVFESIGLTENFFNNDSDDDSSYPQFRKWINELNELDTHTNSIISLLPVELGPRIFGKNLPENWGFIFVRECIDQLIVKLDNYSFIFTNERRKLGAQFEANNKNKLVEFLLRKGFLPSFSFPIDVCNFEILKSSGHKVDSIYSPSQGMAQALSTYVPGQKIDIDKRTYRSAGIYVPFPKNLENRFEDIIPNIDTYIMHCGNCYTLTTWEGEKPNEKEECSNCGARDRITMPMYTPQAFAPISSRSESVEEDSSGDEVKHKPSKVMLPISTKIDINNMDSIFSSSKILCETEKEFFQLNLGPETKDDDELKGQASGWHFCNKCGTCRDSLTSKAQSLESHRRVYPNIDFGPNKFSTTICRSDQWRRLALGYKFKTDMVLLRVNLDSEDIHVPDINNDKGSKIRDATQSAIEAIIQAVVTSQNIPLDIDPNEINGHHRILWGEGKDEDNLVLELYLFDSASGGAGFANQIREYFEEVVDEAIEILEKCNCDSSCHKCLRNYSNKFYHSSLNRMWGSALLKFIRDGEIPELEKKYTDKLIQKIIIPGIMTEENGQVNAKLIDDSILQIEINENEIIEVPLHIRLPFMPEPDLENRLSLIDSDIINDTPSVVSRIGDSVH